MKRIELCHHVCDYTCMVNGLEDLYESKTGTRLPDWFFFYMSGMAGFAYIQNKRAAVPRMVNWGTRIRDQYTNLGAAAGFHWKIHEASSAEAALRVAKASVDEDNPPVLGALDMYHLPYYEKFYHRFHIPYHYVLMTGYDDEQQIAWVLDCGKLEPQRVPYSDLRNAWDVHVPGISKANTLFRFFWEDAPRGEYEIACRALSRQAHFMLHPPAGMLGVRGMTKLAKELAHWPEEMTPEALRKSLYWLVEFTGSPPLLPPRLLGDAQALNEHSGARKDLAGLLSHLSVKCNRADWSQAGKWMAESGVQIAAMTDSVVDYLLGRPNGLKEAEERISTAARIEENAWRTFIDAEEAGW